MLVGNKAQRQQKHSVAVVTLEKIILIIFMKNFKDVVSRQMVVD